MFIKLPIIISVKEDDPRTMMGIIEDEHLLNVWYGDDDESQKLKSEEELIAETSYIRVEAIDAIYPARNSAVTNIDVSGRSSLVLKPCEEIMKMIEELK